MRLRQLITRTLLKIFYIASEFRSMYVQKTLTFATNCIYLEVYLKVIYLFELYLLCHTHYSCQMMYTAI